MLTRPLGKPYSAANTVPVPTPDNHDVQVPIARGGAPGLHLPYRSGEPLMRIGHGGVIPAAQDPTDSRTWRVPVVFT